MKKITGYFLKLFSKKEKEPAQAYDLWASGYDDQPGNLMLDMDEALCDQFFNEITIAGKTVADVGCGTGRHWKKIMDKKPGRLIGFDVSEEMLKKLREKFPHAETYCVANHHLQGIKNNSCDIIISTLTIAHIENAEDAMLEWDRVLKPGGELIITDYHPELLGKGGKRTFRHKGKTITVKNYIHPIEKLRAIARQLHWNEMSFAGRKIDASVRAYYEKQQALSLFEQYKGVMVIYGIHFKKTG
jgi:ubiquinone/menaquinone biosynthesis C-methylase UbiE